MPMKWTTLLLSLWTMITIISMMITMMNNNSILSRQMTLKQNKHDWKWFQEYKQTMNLFQMNSLEYL